MSLDFDLDGAPFGPPGPPEPGVWTFWADTAVPPHTQLGPLVVTGFSPTWRLSGFGAAEVTIPVAESPALSREQILSLWSWRLWASYDGRVVWAGLPTGVDDPGAASVALSFTELPGYLTKRVLDPAVRYTQIEQTEIARQLALPVADVGVQIITDPGPGFARDRSYELLEGAQDGRAELLTNLSQVISGPEFRAEYDLETGYPRCSLAIRYPRVGGDTGLGLVVPGGAVDFSARWDSDQLRTRTYAVGDVPEDAPEDTPKPVAVVDAPQAGLPRLDVVDDWPSVILQSTLEERAATNAQIYARPVLTLTAAVAVHDPPLWSYRVGDDVAVGLADPLMPGGLELTGVLTEVSASAADGTVSWTVAVTLPPPSPADTLASRLADLTRISTGTFRRRLVKLP
jgi:hypothetical protein